MSGYFNNYLRHRDLLNQAEVGLSQAMDEAEIRKEEITEEKDRAGTEITMGLTPLIEGGQKIYDLAQKAKSLTKLKGLLNSDDFMKNAKQFMKNKFGIQTDDEEPAENTGSSTRMISRNELPFPEAEEGDNEMIELPTPSSIANDITETTGEEIRPAVSALTSRLSSFMENPRGAVLSQVNDTVRDTPFGLNTEDDEFGDTPSLVRVRPTEFIPNENAPQSLFGRMKQSLFPGSGEGDEGGDTPTLPKLPSSLSELGDSDLFDAVKSALPSSVGEAVGAGLGIITAGVGLYEGMMSIKDALKESKLANQEEQDLQTSEQVLTNNPVLSFGKAALSSQDSSLMDNGYFSHF